MTIAVDMGRKATKTNKVTANFTNFSKGSDNWQLEKYDSSSHSRVIYYHLRFLDVNLLEHYNTERKQFFFQKGEKNTANLSLLEGDSQMESFPVDGAFASDSSGMHNSNFTQMSVRTL